MADEDDNFDLDIYGDDAPAENLTNVEEEGVFEDQVYEDPAQKTLPDRTTERHEPDIPKGPKSEQPAEPQPLQPSYDGPAENTPPVSAAFDQLPEQPQLPEQAPVQQGVKRKEGGDDRPIDQGAAAAFVISEMPWYITEDDIRGWAKQSECEDELREITFNEHKVNGKSKG